MQTKILAVDDSKTIRMVIQSILGAFDCAFCEATNGEEGLVVAAREKPDLILLDLSMPVMDGVSLLAALRQDPQLRAIPVILLSAELKGQNAAAFSRLKVSDYLVKPFKEKVLLEKVRKIVPLSPKPDAPEFSQSQILRAQAQPHTILKHERTGNPGITEITHRP